MAGSAYAVVAGVEGYQSEGITPVEFARADATGFADILTTHLEVPQGNVLLWLDQDANRTRLELELRYHVTQLGPEDRFYFFYAGHGLWSNGSNRLTAWDTHPEHLQDTTVDVERALFAPLRSGHCRRSLVFVDACAAEFDDPSVLGREMLAGMRRERFEEFVSGNVHTAAFFSCSPREKSYPAKALGHGIWTYHLLRALRGEERDASIRGTVTGQALQDYLGDRVPKYIRERTRLRGRQTPYAVIGAQGAFEIRKMPAAPALVGPQGLAAARPDFSEAFFRGRETRRFDRLPGFTRSLRHTVPDRRSGSASDWARRLLADEIKAELDEVYRNAKAVLGLRRSGIVQEVSPDGGGGTVDTDWFRFSLEAGQSAGDPGDAVIEREVTLRVPHADLPEDFDTIFPASLNELVVPFAGSDKLFDDLVDGLEDVAPRVGGRVDESPRTGRIELSWQDGSKVVFNTRDQRMIVRPAGAWGCTTVIAALGKGALPLLVGTPPLLIGAPR